MFDIDALVDEEARTPYEFKAGGESWRVPHVADLTLGQQLALDRGRIVEVLTEVALGKDDTGEWVPRGADLAGIFLGYRAARVGKFQAAWLTSAGMEPGESPASSS